MAYPVVEGTNTSDQDSNSTSHTVSLPSGIQSGETLIVFFGYDEVPSVTFPGDWTFLSKNDHGGADCGMAIYYKKATGSEGGSITVTTGSSQSTRHTSYRISGTTDPDVTPPEVNESETPSDSTTGDPPGLTPSGGSDEYLWLCAVCLDTSRNISTFPTGYSNELETPGANLAGENISIGSCQKTSTAASDDPDTFVWSGLRPAVFATVAVYPGSGEATGQPTHIRLWGIPGSSGYNSQGGI